MEKKDLILKYKCNDNDTYEYFSFDTVDSVPKMVQDNIKFDEKYDEDKIYKTYISMIQNNAEILERDLSDLSGDKLERKMYTILNIASIMIAVDGRIGAAKFIIMNTFHYNIIKPQFDIKSPIFSVIIDDELDDIILGRVTDKVDEPQIVCFHDNKDMVVKPTPQLTTYNQYHIVKLTNVNSGGD